jgi:hypothetical protein
MEKNNLLSCTACKYSTTSTNKWNRHCSSEKHKKVKATDPKLDVPSETDKKELDNDIPDVDNPLVLRKIILHLVKNVNILKEYIVAQQDIIKKLTALQTDEETNI